MFRIFKLAAIACGLALAPQSQAHAGKVPIPCTSEKIIKVADLPGVAMPDGTTVALGYLFQGCFSGKWIGHVGSDRTYLNLPDAFFETMGPSRGLTAMLQEPGFWASAWANKGLFWVEWLWIVVAGGILLSVVFGKGKVKSGTANAASAESLSPAIPSPPSSQPASSPVATRLPASTRQTTGAPAAERMARALRPAVGAGGAAPAFGKR